MKDGLENIDEVFKKAFDGFESNVDPSVWNNVQNSISSGASSTPQVDPSTIAGVGKSLALKIVAGVVFVGAVATTTYFVPDLFKDKETVITENIIEDDIVAPVNVNVGSEVVADEIVANRKEESSIVSEKEEESVTNNNVTVEPMGEERVAENVKEPSVTDNSNLLETQENVSTNNNNSTVNNSSSAVEEKGVVKEVKSTLEVKINVNVISGKAPLTVQFDAYGEGAVVYEWDFDDNSEKEIDESPIHTFLKAGSYFVKCVGVDTYGNSKETYKTIIVEKNISSSLMPLQNLITPNGDGHNDFIKVRGENISKISVRITDLGGNLVYTMNSMDDKWDGKDMAGNKLVQGQYLMIAVAKGVDGENHQKKTIINLLP